MTPIPLDQLGFGWRSHKSAMWWLGLLYRQPNQVHEKLEQMPRMAAAKLGFSLYWHNLPYLILLCIIVRFTIFSVLGVKPTSDNPHLLFHISNIALGVALGIVGGIAFGIIVGIAFGIALGMVGGIVGGIARGITFGIAGGIAKDIAGGIAKDIAGGIALGIAGGIAFGIAFGIPLGIAGGIAKDIAGGIALGIAVGITGGIALRIARGIIFGIAFGIALVIALDIAFGIAGGIAGGIALMISIPRLYYLPLHLILTWPRPRTRLYWLHPAAWDEMCSVPYFGLHRLLVLFAEAKPQEGVAEIERLIDTYPVQKGQALHAKTTLIAREASQTNDLSRLADVAAKLPSGDKGFLAQTEEVKGWIAEVSALQTRLDIINRPAFREPTAELLVKEIENFRHRIAGLREPLATEFRATATQWLAIAERQLDEARRGSTRELTPQVFRAGDPVDREQEAFVPRYAVIGELEQQIMLSAGCPGIVLYGRRRMGKSTILRNLTDFLPTNVTPVVVPMQRPEMFTSVASLTGFVSRELRAQLDGASGGDAEVSDLTGLFQTLKTVNDRLESGDKRLLLGVDEYETIDKKIGDGIFPLDLLDTIRESIQSHRHITWVFAGSHEITELEHAAWTSYLVSARTIETPFFTPAETRLLLTDPVKHSTLWRNNPDKRPRFDAAFWGEGGIDRIQHEAGGWPHLVQLIAETIVDLINNEEQVVAVTPELMEQALDKAVVRGQNVLYELMRRESFLPGEWEYLSAFRKTETQPPPDDENVAASIRRRLLVEENDGQWRLRVPLMARWLRVRG